MNDLEICRLCAEAGGIPVRDANGWPHIPCAHYLRDTSDENVPLLIYSPLTNKAQAMDLVIALKLVVSWSEDGEQCLVEYPWDSNSHGVTNVNLLSAICLCAAQVQQAKKSE